MNTHRQIFERFVPLQAASYCAKLLDHYGFELKIKRRRQTKLGDYRYNPQTEKHSISINNDLNKYSFLVTYLHEVAHLVTYKQYGRKSAPHGKEWKANFRKIAEPVLISQVFPSEVLSALHNYFKNPKAASCSDPILYNILKQYDQKSYTISLSEIKIGETFLFNKTSYRKLEKKRTRSVCLALSTGKKYLISEIAPVVKQTIP